MYDNNDYLTNPYDPDDTTPRRPQLPMKWHKFLIYFALWAGMVLNAITAVTTAIGLHYGSADAASMVYSVFPAMRPADIVYAVLLLLIVVYSFMTRSALARFKAKGPAMLLRLRVLSFIFALVYPVLASIVTKMPFAELADFPTLISTILLAVLESLYYSKRSHMFTK